MGNELVARQPMTAVEVRSHVDLIKSIMNEVMVKDHHFGVIPGCGDKPTLLKPGAEKLSMTFRLRPIMDNDRDIAVIDLPDHHREVRVYCHIVNAEGLELATGVGCCSTMESKFRYRGGEKTGTGGAVPTKYWNLKKQGKKDEAMELLGGPGYGTGKIDGVWQICILGEKMENPDIADTYNTVLKMAKKRAYIDGILSATAASDIFTQDLEDMAENAGQPASEKNPVKDPVAQPAKKTEPAAQAAGPATAMKDMDILQAMDAQVGEIINVHGILKSWKTRKPKEKEITDYTIGDFEITDKTMTISRWGTAPEGLTEDCYLTFIDVLVKEYKGTKGFVAKDIKYEPVVE
jgi:hypothetical protein